MALRRRGLAAAAAAVVLLVGACNTARPIDMTDGRVAAGEPRTCGELDLSAVRCTLVTLRAARELERLRPDHGPLASQQLHAAVVPAPGASPLASSEVAPAVVVFTLEDGSRIGVPVICPRNPAEGDQACDPRIQ